MRKQIILNRFHNEGIFPTESELEVIAGKGPGGTLETFAVEMELLEIASADVNHPYHKNTQPV